MLDPETARALTAYYRAPGDKPVDSSPDPARSGPKEVEGKRYIVLRSGVGTVLAVYRVRVFDGQLKRLKRWPAEVEG